MAAIIPVSPALNACSECEASDSAAMLLNTFLIRKKQYRVYFNAGKLVWERFNITDDRTTVQVENILAIKSPLNQPSASLQNVNSAGDDAMVTNVKQFTIFYAKRMENSSNPNKWRHVSQTFQNNDSHVCEKWIETLQKQIGECVGRPKRLLLFVNPYGGKKKALRIYDGTVKPIFQLAGIDASVVISQRSNQIRDFIMTQSLEHFDGIVCIGGDGTFSELFNGFIFRTLKDLGLDDINDLGEVPPIHQKPLGIIPGGSTDTVAYCLNGTCDIRTIVLNIVLGQVHGLDLSSVSNPNGLLKFYASVMSYGFLGDVAVESENFRWMGPKRYDYSGFKKLLLNRGYECEISMMVDSFAKDPLKGPACLNECAVCANDENSTKIDTKPAVINATKNSSDKNDNNNEQASRNADNRIPANSNKGGTTAHNAKDKDNEIRTINGKFFMVNGANISCACPRSPNGFSKYCHLCDGYIDLILVRHTSFINNLRFLMAMSSRNCQITDLNHVEIYRTKQFSFKPTGLQVGASAFNLHNSRASISRSNEMNHTSVWNCDGEVVYDSDVSIRSHRNLIKVYRRELYVAHKDDGASETSCCC